MIIVGLLLALAGIWSVRVAFLAAGFGASWLIADAFGASPLTGILVALAGGALALVVAFLASGILFFAVGAVVGAVVGARLFVLLDTGDASVLLAVVFVPAVAGIFGVMAGRWRQRFLGWATAIGGAALVLSGIGTLLPDTVGYFADSDEPWKQVASAVVWAALSVGARLVQKGLSRRDGGRSSATVVA